MTAQPASEESERLIAAAGRLDVRLERTQALRLLQLLDELTQWNRAYNLTAINERSAMIRAHLLDSLSAAADLSGTRIADVGTGAGFPGLPLAVACPERSFTLIDSVAKKIRFVTHAARVLELRNVVALQSRVEFIHPTLPFDTVMTRAFASLPAMLESIRGISGPTTLVLALKGRYPHEELAQLPPGWRLDAVRSVLVPDLGAERHIVRLLPASTP
jgi:16S rRNA (guanine527-N7)-methyltransferase